MGKIVHEAIKIENHSMVVDNFYSEDFVIEEILEKYGNMITAGARNKAKKEKVGKGTNNEKVNKTKKKNKKPAPKKEKVPKAATKPKSPKQTVPPKKVMPPKEVTPPNEPKSQQDKDGLKQSTLTLSKEKRIRIATNHSIRMKPSHRQQHVV
ncbi:protein TonB-like [Sitodiplosis mosellana]|uniref:protein TonB-like n=1 Tax=Sitodiplosis mosellana TaxID=263140 RepID=UPI002444A9CF|nr:protein TonB-like [Sitodiplosis mosellana]